MKHFNGTVTLSLLDEDNSQRVIFRIIPLCTKAGLIFQNRKTMYPDSGSLRIIPDKREQSSFKERMRAIGTLCCVQLLNNGKELTKIRQNRNYDPNQGECNQYAIYSDVVCGFERDAIFEVFQEEQSNLHALTENVLVQRGKVLYGPIQKGETIQWDAIKPFGNENYLLHMVEDMDGNGRTFYWNPDAAITWRQRKKAVRRNVEPNEKPAPVPAQIVIPSAPEAQPASQEQIPIGIKLDILNEQLTNEEQITELNLPVSDDANRLTHGDKRKPSVETVEAPHFHGTPISEAPKNASYNQHKDDRMHGVIEKQLKERQNNHTPVKSERRHVDNPIENLRNALQTVWQVPALHQDLIRVLGENREITNAILQSPLMDCQAKSAYSAAKAELDVIEAERISLLVELDKVKANYQQTKDKMYAEMTKQRQDEISSMEAKLQNLKEEKKTLEDVLSEYGDRLQKGTMDLLAEKGTILVSSNGSDLTIAPTIGHHIEPKEIVESIRSTMSDIGFLCKQDCVTEFLVILSISDEICVLGRTIWEAETYVKNVLCLLGLLNVTAWPSVFGALHIVSLLPENDQRTPTVEVIKNNRSPIRVYGHKTLRLTDQQRTNECGLVPVFRIPEFSKEHGRDKIMENGKPVSLYTLDSFSRKAEPLYKDGETWLDMLERKLDAAGVQISRNIYHAVRVFVRAATPQLIGGFSEAADAAALAWIVPQLMQQKIPKDRLMDVIGDLPRCIEIMNKENN